MLSIMGNPKKYKILILIEHFSVLGFMLSLLRELSPFIFIASRQSRNNYYLNFKDEKPEA